jgi:hypothetical protein
LPNHNPHQTPFARPPRQSIEVRTFFTFAFDQFSFTLVKYLQYTGPAYSAEQLRDFVRKKIFPLGISAKRPEEGLREEEFPACFGMRKAEFAVQPGWKQLELRKAAKFY